MKQPQVRRLALDLFSSHKGRLTFLLIITTAGFLTMPVGQWLFGQGVNAMQRQVHAELSVFQQTIYWWAGLVFGFAALRGVYLYFMNFFRAVTVQTLLHSLRERVFDRVQMMELDWHHKHGAGELITRTTRDCDMVRNATEAGFQLIEIATMVTGSLVLLYIYHWQLAIVPALLVIPALWMYYRQAITLVRLNRKTDDAYDHVTQDLTEGIAGVRVVKAFGLEKQRLLRFGKHVDTFIEHGLRAVKYAAVRIPLPQLVVSCAHPWVLIWGILLMAAGTPTTFSNDSLALGDLLVALMAMTTVIFRLDGMGSAMRMIAEALASMQRLSEVIYAEEKIKSGTHEIGAGPLTVSLQDVVVHDDKGHPILRDCNVRIVPGEIVALIGSTGSGKSTLCALLSRLKDVHAGQVLLRDESGKNLPLSDCVLHQLRQRVQVVPQESFLFSDTIAGNMRMGKATASDAEIWTALADAGIDDFIRGFEQQLETPIGERGMNLSGGQKQRLCLARALLGKPDVLVLDDSTSALDAVTEQHIFKRMRQQNGGGSILLVTTRLSSVLLADRVLLLGGGKIIGDGTHQQLAREHAQYRELLCLDQEPGQ